jgi:hypothetical protein
VLQAFVYFSYNVRLSRLLCLVDIANNSIEQLKETQVQMYFFGKYQFLYKTYFLLIITIGIIRLIIRLGQYIRI